MSEYQDTLKQEFLDEDYRYAYSEDFLNTTIATQIKVLRAERGLSQEALGEKIGTKQEGISRLENVNYSAWKTQTLRKLARALGVRLRISFETFGTLIEESSLFSSDSLKRPKFEDDPAFKNLGCLSITQGSSGNLGSVEAAFTLDKEQLKRPIQLGLNVVSFRQSHDKFPGASIAMASVEDVAVYQEDHPSVGALESCNS